MPAQPKSISLHGHSKDEIYIFVMTLALDFNIREDLLVNQVQEELERSFRLEHYHSEYEKLNQHTGFKLRERETLLKCTSIDNFIAENVHLLTT